MVGVALHHSSVISSVHCDKIASEPSRINEPDDDDDYDDDDAAINLKYIDSPHHSSSSTIIDITAQK